MTIIGVEYKLKITKRMNVTSNMGHFLDKNILISNNIYRGLNDILFDAIVEFYKNKLYKYKESDKIA